jgi:hypothetical protein
MIQQQSKNEPGFWLIELDATAILSSNPAHHGFARSFLAWIASEVSNRLDLPSQSIRLAVVEAQYQGSYPCLGAQHPSGRIADSVATEIESTLCDVLNQTSLATCFDSMTSRQVGAKP